MSEIKKVVVIGGGAAYEDMFVRKGWGIAHHVDDADLIQFTGGADVTPDLYDRNPHPQTGFDPIRDNREKAIFEEYVGKKPMAGVCRGGQFLWVMNGGEMYQHVDGHAIGNLHEMANPLDVENPILVTSTHHQMMKHTEYTKEHAEILGIAFESTYKEYIDENGEKCVCTNDQEDLEVAYFKETNCLCFQPHPEYMPNSNMEALYFRLIEDNLL